MTFKKGQSGNPSGRRKGALSRRAQLSKLLEPHAEALISKMIELALSGDVTALRLCIERLIPKIHREPMGIELPSEINQSNLIKVKDEILRAAVDGCISIDDADKLITLVNDQHGKHASSIIMPQLPSDPLEAARVYQQVMMS